MLDPLRRAMRTPLAFVFSPRASVALVMLALLALICVAPATAANATATLSGTITNNGTPAASVRVTASGHSVTLNTTTDTNGHFAFARLPLGTYSVSATSGQLKNATSVDLTSGGTSITLALGAVKKIGSVLVSQSHTEVIQGSGSDVVLNAAALTELPFNNSFSEMEIQLPGAARGANGVVHLNGDHGVVNYEIDGVPLPQELNRDIGSEIDLNDLTSVDVVEGAFPARDGLKFGSVFNLTTRSGTGPAGFDGTISAGSYTNAQSTLGYHAPLPGGGGIAIALSGLQTSRGLDPPNFSSPHNNSGSLGQFIRLTLPNGKTDFTNLTIINSQTSYQIPNDVANGQPATTDDSENQAETFITAQYHHALGDTGALTFGPALKISRIRDFGDPSNDFAYGEALNVEAPPYGNGSTSTACATALANPGAYVPTTCAYSLNDNRTAVDYSFQTDYTQKYGKHTFSSGASYDLSRVLKTYAITLQPNNFLAPIETPATPGAATTVTDNSPNLGSTYTSYVEDSWRMSPLWQADYGIRYDYFSIKSSDFAQGFGATSPRLKITRSWGDRANVYAYIGRFFEPFSLENVSPQAAQLLDLPLQAQQAQFDLKPERDTQIELGGHLPFGPGDLGFRIWQKNANDLVDDTQVGTTLLHQDINYRLGRLSQEALNYTQSLARNSRAYVSVAHVVSHNSGCETQLLAPCFGSPTGYTPADHEQAYSVTSGVLLNNRRGGWFSADGEYGSGLSSAQNPAGGITCAGLGLVQSIGGPCKRTPHLTFSAEEGYALSQRTALTFSIDNIFNDRYFVTYLNAQGNHYAPPREFDLGLRFKP